MVRKSFGNVYLKDLTMKRKRLEEFEVSMWRLWMNQSYFSLGFLSQNSLWKLSEYRGYKGIYIVGWEGMWKVSFSQTRWSGDLTSQLDWVASLSCKLMAWSTWDFCPVVQQLAWLFSSPACSARVLILAACQSRVTRESSRESLHPWTILSISSHSLIHYPYMIPT